MVPPDSPPRSRLRRLPLALALGLLSGLVVKDLKLPAAASYWGSIAPVALVVALLLCLLYLTRLRWLVVALTVALVGLWVAVAFTPLSSRLLSRVTRPENTSNADAIFVFSSALQRDGDPTPVSASRLLRGLELLGEHRAPRLVLSELPAPNDRYAALARDWMKRLGVQGEVLTIGPVGNTHDEAQKLAELCRKNGWKTVLAVSSPAHARRALAVLRREGLDAAWAPAVETRFDVERLVSSDDRLEALPAALHELVGFTMYRARGWVGTE